MRTIPIWCGLPSPEMVVTPLGCWPDSSISHALTPGSAAALDYYQCYAAAVSAKATIFALQDGTGGAGSSPAPSVWLFDGRACWGLQGMALWQSPHGVGEE